MDERAYEGLIARYAPSWNAPAATTPVAALAPSLPTGKPTNADFPSAASTPPVNIMTPEPGSAPAPRPPAAIAAAPSPSSRPTSTATPAPAAAKKQAAPKAARAPAPPTPLAPATAPAASND